MNVQIVSDKVALRIAIDTVDRDGYTKNLSISGKDWDDRDDRSYRASLLLEPFDGLRNITVADYLKVDTVSLSSIVLAALNAGGARNAAPEALLYPDFLAGASVAEVTAHMTPLDAAHALDLVPVDPRAGFSGQLDENGLPVGKNRTRFSFDDANEVSDLAIRLGHPVTVGVFEPFHLRWAMTHRRAGKLPPGSIAKLYLAGDYSLIHIGKRALNFGLRPTEAAIGAYLSMLGSDMPWCLGVVGGATLNTSVVGYAIERGGHVRMGIEDAAGRSNQTSADMVRAAVEMARDIGRPVAQGDAARAALSFSHGT